jgi:predicted acylesterase/phospholipase RssA
MVGLALSGGGFRATLFHLGVIQFLRHIHKLEEVTHICSVSGGSILAAHLALNWKLYNGTDIEFKEATNAIVDFVRQDVRGRIVRRCILSYLFLGIPTWMPWVIWKGGRLLKMPSKRLLRIWEARWTRVALLQRHFDVLYAVPRAAEDREGPLFRRAMLSSLGEGLGTLSGRARELHILATSMTTGELCSFSNEGVFKGVFPSRKIEGVALAGVPVSLAVAASSAFPPMFPPIEVSHETLQCDPKEWGTEHYLTDGGIYDNVGTSKFVGMHKDGRLQVDRLVVSEAQLDFNWNPRTKFRFLPGRALRSTDILMDRVGKLEAEAAEGFYKALEVPLVRCRLSDTVVKEGDRFCFTDAVQKHIRSVRTDLDRFSTQEIDALVAQGYLIAKQAWKSNPATAADVSRGEASTPSTAANVPSGEASRPWTSVESTAGRCDDDGIPDAKERPLGLFRLRDGVFWISLIVFAGYAISLALVIQVAVKKDVVGGIRFKDADFMDHVIGRCKAGPSSTSLYVVTDLPSYGAFTHADAFERYLVALKDRQARADNPVEHQVRCVFLSRIKRKEVLEIQFEKAKLGEEFAKRPISDEDAKKVSHYLTHGYGKKVLANLPDKFDPANDVKRFTYDDLIEKIALFQDDLVVKELKAAGVSVRYVPGPFTVHIWSGEETRALATFVDVSGAIQELGINCHGDYGKEMRKIATEIYRSATD